MIVYVNCFWLKVNILSNILFPRLLSQQNARHYVKYLQSYRKTIYWQCFLRFVVEMIIIFAQVVKVCNYHDVNSYGHHYAQEKKWHTTKQILTEKCKRESCSEKKRIYMQHSLPFSFDVQIICSNFRSQYLYSHLLKVVKSSDYVRFFPISQTK